jgi:glutaredoxin-like protein NrdH
MLFLFHSDTTSRVLENSRIMHMNTPPVSIKMYTLTTCGHCRAAKQFLEDNGFTYRAVDLDTLSETEKEARLEELRAINPSCTVPTAIIGDRVIVGFREDGFREALGLK